MECTATQTYDCFKNYIRTFFSRNCTSYQLFFVFFFGDFDKATIWIQNSFLTKKWGIFMVKVLGDGSNKNSLEVIDSPWKFKFQNVYYMSYYWWTESCTCCYGKFPIIYMVLYIPGGAGFFPSTVLKCILFRKLPIYCMSYCHTKYMVSFPWISGSPKNVN